MRREHEQLVAGTEQTLECEEQRVGATLRDRDVVGLAANPVLALELLDQRLAERERAAGVRIVRLPRARRRRQGLDDVGGSPEVGLAALQVEDARARLLADPRRRHHLSKLRGQLQEGPVRNQPGHGESSVNQWGQSADGM